MNLEDVINRRGDLSTFIVHLTRQHDENSGAHNLKNILTSGSIEAKNSYGCAVKRLEGNGFDPQSFQSQKVVSFTETPLEYIYLLLEQMDTRQINFLPYGLAFTKVLARKTGVNPVWYLDITPGHNWLTGPFERLLDGLLLSDKTGQAFENSDIAKLTPFVEQMGTQRAVDGTVRYRKEFWWEREWRCAGNFNLPVMFIGLCPEEEIVEFESFSLGVGRCIKFIDPRWRLEKIIAKLSGFSAGDIDIL